MHLKAENMFGLRSTYGFDENPWPDISEFPGMSVAGTETFINPDGIANPGKWMGRDPMPDVLDNAESRMNSSWVPQIAGVDGRLHPDMKTPIILTKGVMILFHNLVGHAGAGRIVHGGPRLQTISCGPIQIIDREITAMFPMATDVVVNTGRVASLSLAMHGETIISTYDVDTTRVENSIPRDELFSFIRDGKLCYTHLRGAGAQWYVGYFTQAYSKGEPYMHVYIDMKKIA